MPGPSAPLGSADTTHMRSRRHPDQGEDRSRAVPVEAAQHQPVPLRCSWRKQGKCVRLDFPNHDRCAHQENADGVAAELAGYSTARAERATRQPHDRIRP